MGELTLITLDSLSEISLEKHFNNLQDIFFREYNQYHEFNYEFKSGKILSNGDLLLYVSFDDQYDNEQNVVLLVFDLKRNILKSFKNLNNLSDSVILSPDKICSTYRCRNKNHLQKDFDDSEVFEVDKDREYVILVLNENLEKLHRF